MFDFFYFTQEPLCDGVSVTGVDTWSDFYVAVLNQAFFSTGNVFCIIWLFLDFLHDFYLLLVFYYLCSSCFFPFAPKGHWPTPSCKQQSGNTGGDSCPFSVNTLAWDGSVIVKLKATFTFSCEGHREVRLWGQARDGESGLVYPQATGGCVCLSSLILCGRRYRTQRTTVNIHVGTKGFPRWETISAQDILREETF